MKVQYDYISAQDQLEHLCADLSAATTIAIDTEFVSEDTYQPELCLLQVAGGERLAILDPQTLENLQPLWQLLTEPGRQTVVHAGRQEFLFCLEATGERPNDWYDVQLAAGFVGLEYPAAYSTLISRLLNRSLPKAETRTNWRRRPLSARQLEYAAQDVAYLASIRDVLQRRISQLQRTQWLAEELAAWQEEIVGADRREGWRRVSGISGLSARQLAIVREVWRWRDAQALQRNCPPRRVLRDDLIVELARRQAHDLSRIKAIRGLERRDLQRHLGELSDSIRRACELEAPDYPDTARGANWNSPQLQLLGQFLATALGSLCRQLEIAPSLVATTQELRDLVSYRLGLGGTNDRKTPALAHGWRAEVVGQVVDELLSGRLAVRVHDPRAENPLQLAPTPSNL